MTNCKNCWLCNKEVDLSRGLLHQDIGVGTGLFHNHKLLLKEFVYHGKCIRDKQLFKKRVNELYDL